MAYSPAAWREQLTPASFRGAEFHVEVGAYASGRRVALHEFPKRNTPYAEDMGRRARRFPVTGYIVDTDYIPLRDQLIAALEAEGGGTLVLPTTAPQRVICDGFSAIERRERGGFVEFEMTFVEAGSLAGASMTASADTTGAINAAADSAGDASASTLDGSLDAYDTPGFNASDVQNIGVGQLSGATLNDFTLPGFEGADIDNAGIGQLQSGDLTSGAASVTQTDGTTSAASSLTGRSGAAAPEIYKI